MALSNQTFAHGDHPFTFTFDYFEADDITVSKDGTVLSTSSYTLVGKTVTLNTAPTNGTFKISRQTDRDAAKATFYVGSAIKAEDLNNNVKQTLFLSQENLDQVTQAQQGELDDGSITGSKLANLTITDSKLASDSVNTDKILENAVTADKLSDSASNDGLRAVTTNHIRNDAVTTDKLAHDITIQNDLTVSNNLNVTGNLNVTNVTTFTDNINFDGSSLKLKFRDSGGTNDALLYSDGTDFRLELKDAINDFKIFDGTTLRYTFADNGNLTCTGSVTATSFVGNADTATTSGAVEVASSGFGDASNRPIACFGTSSTPSGGGSSEIKFPNSNAPTIKGDGLIKAKNGIEVTGNVDATGNISATGNLNGTLGNGQVRNAIALGNANNKGTYAFCSLVNNTTDRAAGYEAAGSDLRFSNADAIYNGTPSGTWRLMGRLAGNSAYSSTRETSLWLRIS